MSYQGTTSNNDEITEEGSLRWKMKKIRIKKSKIMKKEKGTTSNNNEIIEEAISNNKDVKEGMPTSDSNDVSEDSLIVFLACNGTWGYDGKAHFFKNSTSATIFVNKYITLSEIKDIIFDRFGVDKKLYHIRLEVHYGTGSSPWFPVTWIDADLAVFILETLKKRLPLCVTMEDAGGFSREFESKRIEDDTVEKRLLRAIQRDGWVKAREILNNTEEVTWTSELDDKGNTAFHFAVGEFKDNKVVRDIVKALQSNRDLLLTTLNNSGETPVHTAATCGNTEALKIMLDFNPLCSFVPDKFNIFAISYAFVCPAVETFQYLLKQMKWYSVDQFETYLTHPRGLDLFSRVIEARLIVEAYELIKDYPSIATEVAGYEHITPLQRIIRKPDLFYSGTHYNFYQRFVYRHVPIKNKSLGSTHTADEENQETPKKDKFVTNHTLRCLYNVIWRIWAILWKTTLLHVPHVKHLKDTKVRHHTTIKLLRLVCKETDKTYTESDIESLYSSPLCLAVENDTPEAIDFLTTYFPILYKFRNERTSVYRLTVLNRSEKVYRFIMNRKHDAISDLMREDDYYGNNILHFAGRLAPVHKLNAASGAALQMQRELQWFEEVKRVVGIAHTRKLNENKETPMMVFRREHEKLRKEGEEWMKKTADSYTITAALIITIVFAAAITVPGGNDNATGKPIYGTKSSLIVFAISDAISLFTSTTALLLFLSILTARYADEDFLYKFPKRLIFGLVMLFVSVTCMMIAFSATLYIMFGQGKAWILIPIAALACLPIASFVTLQFPLLQELISSTYGPGIFSKQKDYWESRANANKKKRA